MSDPKKSYGTKVTFQDGSDAFLAFKAASALYDTLKTDLGLDEVTSNAIYVRAATFCDRLGVIYEKSTGVNRYGKVWCRPDKYDDCRKTLTGTYRGKAIKGTYDPLDGNRS